MAASSLLLPSPTSLLRHHHHTAPIRALSPTSSTSLTQDDLKKLAAIKAVEHVRNGMALGATGSTAAFVIAEIDNLLSSGKLDGIIGIPTSTFEQAQSLGIPLSALDDHPHLDLARG